MSMLHTPQTERLLELTTPDGDELLREMEARADREGFPIVGAEVGAVLRLLARTTGAESVFEFGSGFGYSAYWIAPAVGPDGLIVLTEVDADELDDARTYFERGGYDDRASFELGDAMEIVERYDGPFEMVLLDHMNADYVDAFEIVREKVPEGGVVIADNVLKSSETLPEDIETYMRGGDPARGGTTPAELTDYFRHVRDDPDFETTPIPVGDGLFVSVRI